MVEYSNGRFRTSEIAVRNLGNLAIYFWNKEEIFVIDKSRHVRYIFHRWFNPEYIDWRTFRIRLMEKKTVEISWLFETANQHNIKWTVSYRKLDLSGKKMRFVK